MKSGSAHISDRKRIAWDGVSFLIPGNWELALYKFLKKGVTRVEIEDEYAVRLEAEWVRPKKRLQVNHVLSRYERKSKKLSRLADTSTPVANLPQGWAATHHVFSETVPGRKAKGLAVAKHGLVTAFYLSGDSKLFCFMMLHFLPQDRENPAETIRLVAGEFRHHFDSPLVPWRLFDIAFEVPRDFLLENTLFELGAKLMTFRWNLRRLFLWHFSCADMFLKEGVNMAEWVAGYINSSRRIRGGAFWVDAGGRIVWKRRKRHLLAHRDQIARLCFRYEARYSLDKEANQLIVWVFNYRKPSDLQAIPESLRFETSAQAGLTDP